MRFGVLTPPIDGTSRICNVRKNARRPLKNVVRTCNTRIKRDVVLNFYVVAQNNFGRNDDVLTNIAVVSKRTARHDVAKMPNFSAFANRATRVNNGGFVSKKRINDE